jgi:hypothetical protein
MRMSHRVREDTTGGLLVHATLSAQRAATPTRPRSPPLSSPAIVAIVVMSAVTWCQRQGRYSLLELSCNRTILRQWPPCVGLQRDCSGRAAAPFAGQRRHRLD